mmetsp:Transcript_22972/g.68982  ORF Transcript_22972/g.68982 Transcript_22972/m.68982 type:complete len:249 (+) Transcript_22972:308-1054(+)
MELRRREVRRRLARLEGALPGHDDLQHDSHQPHLHLGGALRVGSAQQRGRVGVQRVGIPRDGDGFRQDRAILELDERSGRGGVQLRELPQTILRRAVRGELEAARDALDVDALAREAQLDHLGVRAGPDVERRDLRDAPRRGGRAAPREELAPHCRSGRARAATTRATVVFSPCVRLVEALLLLERGQRRASSTEQLAGARRRRDRLERRACVPGRVRARKRRQSLSWPGAAAGGAQRRRSSTMGPRA